MGSFHENIQLVLAFLKAPFLILHFSYCTLITFLMKFSVILPFMLMIITLYLKSDQTSDLWQQLELAFELKSDLRDTEDWGRKWFQLVYIGQLVSSFDQSNKNGTVEVKMDRSVLGEK